jgi:hypothetical protein
LIRFFLPIVSYPFGANVIFRGSLFSLAVTAETDELENLELAQQTAREEAYKAAKKVAGKYEDK